MIYTSYYARANFIPNLISCISISRTVPKWFCGMPHYPKLAPSYELLKDWKSGKITWDNYTERYVKETLNHLNPIEVQAELFNLVRPFDDDICLICYEKQICHRHIVANWFTENGISCKEYDFTKEVPVNGKLYRANTINISKQ